MALPPLSGAMPGGGVGGGGPLSSRLGVAGNSSITGSYQQGLASPEIPEVPVLTVEEEMQYQRALWLNRLLKEQLAQLTHNLSIEEIDVAKEQLKAQLGMAGVGDPAGSGQADGWLVRPGEGQGNREMMLRGGVGLGQPKMISPRATAMLSTPRRGPQASSSAVNRKKREAQIDRENLGFLRRLQNVKSSFHKLPPPTAIPKLSMNSRLLQPSRRDALGMLG